MWLASVIQGHRNPFGKPLCEYTTAELDFVIEMASIDDPDHIVFRRGGVDQKQAETEARAKWIDVLAGPMLRAYRRATGTARADDNLKAWYAKRKQGRGMRVGLSRQGKPLDAGDSKGGRGQ